MKVCPDLITTEWVVSNFVGNGDFQRVVLNECIKEKCVAYENGMCRKYMNKAYDTEDEVST